MLSTRRSRSVPRFTKKYTEETDELTIFNLSEKTSSSNFNKASYDEFRAFYNDINKRLDEELKQNTGEILQVFPIKEEFRDNLERIGKDYHDMYINPIAESELYEGRYPKFLQHMHRKSNKVYEKYEELIGFPVRIEEQTDEQIFKTLGLRLDGLKQCQSYMSDNMKEDEKQYYTEEYERELQKYKELELNRELNFADKVEQQCKNIFYNIESLNKYKKSITESQLQNTQLQKIKTFFANNPNEELYARTFLPENCFDYITDENNDGKRKYKINFEKLEELLRTGDRDYRQFIYGFYGGGIIDTIRTDIKPFLYEAGGMTYKLNFNNSCNQLVNWSLFLNMLYCRCGLANTIPLCPTRFILPLNDKNSNKSNGDYKFITFDIRDKTAMSDIFDGNLDTNAEFMGIIVIKYYHEETRELRLWYFFVFKNNDLTNRKRQNTITGVREKIILVNYRLRQINMFGLFEKHNVTHYELLHFINLSKKTDNRKLYFYIPLGINNNDSVFISRRPDLESVPFLADLQLTKATITKEEIPGNYHLFPKTNITIKYKNRYSRAKILQMVKVNNTIHSTIQSGGNGNLPIKIKTTTDERKLYFSDLTLSRYYINFIESLEIVENIAWYTDNINNNYISPDREKIYRYIRNTYPYLIIESNESSFKHLKYMRKSNNLKINTITKYKPLSDEFFRKHELFQKYKLFSIFDGIKENTHSVLNIGTSLSLLEYISYSKYNFKEITNLLTLSHNYLANLLAEWQDYIKNVSSMYNINNIGYTGSIYDISKSHLTVNIPKHKLVVWGVNRVVYGVVKYNSYYNTPLYISGILFSLQHLVNGGILIFTIESVAYKHTADIILIIAQYFDKWDLVYPETYNRYKRSGTNAIFTNFKGITDKDIKYLEDLLEKVKKIYPDDANDYNITDDTLRRELHITRQDIPSKPLDSIISFLDYDINDKIYEPFRLFNDARYMDQLLYITKMINVLSSPDRDKYLDIKLPTNDQITSSIFYCKKYDIPYFDKYNTSKIDLLISRNILSEMYGIHEPILYQFKTPFKTYIANKIILNPNLISIRTKTSSNTRHSILKSIHSNHVNSKSGHSKSTLNLKLTKKISERDTIGAIFRDMFSKTSNHNNSNKISSKHKTGRYRKTRKSSLKRSNISLLNPLFTSNNQLVQVGRLIDSRRDFSKPQKQQDSKTDPQTWLYDEIKEKFRYYKGKGVDRNVTNLDIMVQEYLGDRSISQAWLKMYEIITDCELVPRNQKGIFRSFHICEAPGTFINAINNYIHTKTQYGDFEWDAQSLNPKIAKIKDQFGLIRRHPERWDYGVSQTGDITQVKNINYYKKQVARRPPIQLMTSDCGLEWGNPKYEFVAFASYVAILNILPVKGTMLYKILSPIDLPLMWNLIYITFTNFKEMYFFKPVQNSQSREFYIVAKDYLGTDPKVLDKLLEIIQKWEKLENVPTPYKAKWLEELDLFRDQYPEEFVTQVITISERLAQNYVNSIERIIYYVDNNDLLGNEYKKHIEKYIEEKNEEWMKRYRPKKLDNKWIL